MFISYDPLFWVVASLLVLFVGVAKGGFGGGLVMMAVPVLSFFVSPLIASAVMLPILVVMDITGLVAFWRKWDWMILRFALPCCLLGITIGALVFTSLSVNMVRFIVGVLAVVFALHHWLKPYLNLQDRQPTIIEGIFWLTITGFTSHVAHAGQPPYSVYILPKRLPKEVFAATTVFMFAFINFVKLVPYSLSGQFTMPVLWTAFFLFPLAPVGVYLGRFLMGKINEDVFYRYIYILVFLSGLKLLWDALV